MKRKHMQSHWKELVAEQAARKEQKNEPAAGKAPVKKKAKKVEKATVEAQTEDTIEDEEEAEDEDGKPIWESALDQFHQYRYPALAGSLPILLLCLVAAYGGFDDRPDRVPVSGRVVIDGESLTSGTITFIPENGTHTSIGTIDENGRFTLSCYDGDDGAVPGTHRVEIVLTRALDEGAEPWPVPEMYANHQTSDLTFEIIEPKEDLLVELESNRQHPEGETGPGPLQLPEEGEED